jgi:hypothetical protein
MTWVLALQVAEYSYEIEQSAYPSREAAMDNLVALDRGVEWSLIEVGT